MELKDGQRSVCRWKGQIDLPTKHFGALDIGRQASENSKVKIDSHSTPNTRFRGFRKALSSATRALL